MYRCQSMAPEVAAEMAAAAAAAAAASRILAAHFCCSAPDWRLCLPLDGGSLCCFGEPGLSPASVWAAVFVPHHGSDESNEIRRGLRGGRGRGCSPPWQPGASGANPGIPSRNPCGMTWCGLARAYRLSPVAHALRVNYTGLKRRALVTPLATPARTGGSVRL